jgi:hypothetical protein
MSKLTIRSLDTGLSVTAGFNPKELAFDKDSGWAEDNEGFHKDMNAMQWTTGKSIKLSVELFFDYYEQQKDVRPIIANLVSLTMMISEDKPRPHVVQLLWHDSNVLFTGGKFTGVVNSVNTKYTMFTSDGIPCRATATVSLTQAEELKISVGADKDSATSYDESLVVTEGDPKSMTREQLQEAQAQNPEWDPASGEKVSYVSGTQRSESESSNANGAT